MRRVSIMEVTIMFLLLLLSVCCDNVSAREGDADFAVWRKQLQKRYSSSEEMHKRERIFYDNVQYIKGLNRKYKSRDVKFAVNQFADLSPEEFKSTVLMPSRPAPVFHPDRYVSTHSNDVPEAFDWRDKGVVTEVKDQGSVGSCWAFSTVGNIEAQWALAGHNLTSLSAEQLVDCDSTADPNNTHTDCGVFGGWPYLAYDYIKRTGGIEPESSYSYCSGFGKCFPCMAPGYNKTRCGPPVPPTSCLKNESCVARLDRTHFVRGLIIKSWLAVPKNETTVKSTLVVRGPLSIAINALTLQFYHSGVWDPLLPCDPTELDHAVLLVGYGTKKGLFEQKPYWLIKNSWGKKWGEDGYFRLVRGKDKCGVTQQVTSALLQ